VCQLLHCKALLVLSPLWTAVYAARLLHLVLLLRHLLAALHPPLLPQLLQAQQQQRVLERCPKRAMTLLDS
jgi:hypothetical protein